jgi:hypothetical protein
MAGDLDQVSAGLAQRHAELGTGAERSFQVRRPYEGVVA